MADFAQKIEKLDMDDKNQVNEFEKSCVSFANCFETLQCGPEDPAEKKINNMIKNYCDAVVYVAKDFADCSEKLENKNSTCYQNWDPFPDAIDEETDEKKKEKMLQEACKNYFGKDNCLKKEITEKCSETEWKGFRDVRIQKKFSENTILNFSILSESATFCLNATSETFNEMFPSFDCNFECMNLISPMNFEHLKVRMVSYII